jgi:tripartite-type tricarboxylate transporter receptor subunit TctC
MHALHISERATAMTLSRRRFLHIAAAASSLSLISPTAEARTYPSQPVRLISGFPAGGVNDILARLMGQRLSDRLGQPFVVENRPGAGSNIGTELVVRAPPDGNTLLLVATPNAINAALYEKLSFNFIRDIVPVASIMRQPQVMLVNSSFPAKTVPEFIAYATTNPGKINMASAGNGNSSHVSGELFKMMTGHQYGPRALSWRSARADRSARQTGAAIFRGHSFVDRVHQGRQAACACGDKRDAL